MRRSIVFVSLASIFALPALLLAQSELGTWKLDLAKSKFSVTAPRSRTITVEAHENGITDRTEAIAADGRRTSYTYTANYDGKDYPIVGTGAPRGSDSVALKRIDANTTQITFKKDGKVIEVARISISNDGKFRTASGRETGPDGKPTRSRSVYEKQ